MSAHNDPPGTWTHHNKPPHVGGGYPDGDANTLLPDIVGYLTVKYDLRTVVDVGCGFGHGLKLFEACRVSGLGIDGDPQSISENIYHKERVIQHDFTQGEPALPMKRNERFDLGWSSEFLEHVEEQFLPNYMPIFQRCRFVCVTHGEPGQDGHHHVNLRDDRYWQERFWERGIALDVAETAVLRRTDRGSAWGRRTLMFFVNLLPWPQTPWGRDPNE